MWLMDNCAYANPFLEPASLDAFLAANPDDEQLRPFMLADPAENPERALLESSLHDAVGSFVDGLDTMDRDLVQRVYWGGETQSQVALDYRVSGAAISKRMARIHALGRKVLAAYQNSPVLQ